MSKPTVAYATFCCSKDMERALASYKTHFDSHNYAFDESFLVFQRCNPGLEAFSMPGNHEFIFIEDKDYADILVSFGIQYPDPVLDELTHGWGAPHFWAHHCVNHLRAAQAATSDYIVFADADCHMKDQPEGQSWIDAGIALLESNPDIFVISPNDGGPERRESIMSQQLFLMRRSWLLGMEFIPWDGKFIEGGPFQEYYGLLEGRIARYMTKHNLCRYVLPSQWRYWHKEWH